MPPASKVSTLSVNPPSRSASQSRAGLIASSPWLEMLGKLQSCLSSSTKRREFLSMYASTALVEITPPFLHWPYGRRRLQILAEAEPRAGDQLAPLVGGGLRDGAHTRPADPALHLGGLVPLVPRHGRDHLLQL